MVVQRDSALSAAQKVTVCPITSYLRGAIGQRPFVAPTTENRLRAPSEIEVDWIYTHSIDRVGTIIGKIDDATMELVDIALRRWLDL